MDEEAENDPGRPLLVVVSDSHDLPARVRSRDRDVWRWQPEPPPGADGVFGGDPTRPEGFEWIRDARAVTAVIDLQPADRARAALTAIRAVRPDAAVLVLSDELADLGGARDGTLARGGELRDVLRLDLEEELERLEAERRAHCLREFAAGDDVVPILIHEDPDPDAVSSALAVSALLGAGADRAPIVTFRELTRPENRRMVDLLRILVTTITREELCAFERVITVDTQPGGLQRDGRPRFAVVDHHPAEGGYEAEFADIRPGYGATATMLTEYLRAVSPDMPGRPLATALLFGIRTDTDGLSRAVSPADVEAYAFLQERADLQLVRRFERPSLAVETVHRFGTALRHADCEGDLCVSVLGPLETDETPLLADVADFCLGIEHVTWSVAAALLDDDVVLTIRHVGTGTGAGALARAIARRGGRGGGHATMARAALPPQCAADLIGPDPLDAASIRDYLRGEIDGLGDGEASRG
ncbi:MAG TPA: DHH family phosphoesterase [Longimicrobiales bacterium]|nr:DHH family phosphoesterase [Longimicrobiales bacterium]